jgi:hypothetical protein
MHSISEVALGAGGAYLGDELSNGDPLATTPAQQADSS